MNDHDQTRRSLFGQKKKVKVVLCVSFAVVHSLQLGEACFERIATPFPGLPSPLVAFGRTGFIVLVSENEEEEQEEEKMGGDESLERRQWKILIHSSERSPEDRTILFTVCTILLFHHHPNTFS